MIIGIGVDMEELQRFADWHNYPQKQLSRIFSPEEIAYCLSNKNLTTQRFAVRFVAREAAYKAVSSIFVQPMSFLQFCKFIRIEKDDLQAPIIILHDTILRQSVRLHLSLSHTKHHAIAFVIAEK